MRPWIPVQHCQKRNKSCWRNRSQQRKELSGKTLGTVSAGRNPMIVIVANRQDEVAAWLADRWQSSGPVLLTSADLSASGWRHYLPPSRRSRAMIAARSVVPEAITGVLTRIPCVYEQELGHIVPEDRSYVASEMTAFLLAWLSSLTCPVLNSPTP